MVCLSFPLYCVKIQWAVKHHSGLDIFNAEGIIRRIQDFLFLFIQKGQKGPVPCLGKCHSILQVSSQSLFELYRFIRKQSGNLGESCDIAAFTSKADGVNTEGREQSDAVGGKFHRGCGGKGHRHLDDEIGSG